MRMLMTLEFADAGVKTGIHRVLVLQRNAGLTEPRRHRPNPCRGQATS
jgi:hypothetical protein